MRDRSDEDDQEKWKYLQDKNEISVDVEVEDGQPLPVLSIPGAGGDCSGRHGPSVHWQWSSAEG